MVRYKTKGRKQKASKKKDGSQIIMNKTHAIVRQSHILQEVKKLQQSTNLLIPKATFARLVREIMINLFPDFVDSRIQHSALEALQEAAEMYLVQFFEDSCLICLHSNRVTLMRKDMVLLRRLRRLNDIINR